MPYYPGREPVSTGTTRHERLKLLKQFYLYVLYEDASEGSKFDCDVLDAIRSLEEKYPEGGE